MWGEERDLQMMNISVSHRSGRSMDLSVVIVYIRHDIEVHAVFAKAGKPIPIKIEKTFTSVPKDEEQQVKKAIKLAKTRAWIEQAKLPCGGKLSKMAGEVISRFEVFGGVVVLLYSSTYPVLLECWMTDGDNTSRTLLTPTDARNLIKELEAAAKKVEKEDKADKADDLRRMIDR